jgi:hypothetical protein
MKYMLQWTDANHKCWHLRKPVGRGVLLRQLQKIMPPARPRTGRHAAFITITLAAK